MAMKKDTAKILMWLVGMVIGIIVALLPLVYFSLSYQNIRGALKAEAEINASMVTQIVSAHPDSWEYEEVRLMEYISQRPKTGEREIRRILNARSEPVAESADDVKLPLIVESFVIMDSGVPAGKIEIIRSLRPLLKRSVLVTFLTLSVGLATFILLRIVPLRAIERAETALKKTNEELRRTNQRLLDEIAEHESAKAMIIEMNEGLEMRVHERSAELDAANGDLKRQIEDRRLADEALIRSEEKYRNLVETINETIYEADENGVITFVSRSGKGLRGYESSDIVGKPITDFVYRDDLPHLLEQYQKIMSGPIPPSEYRLALKSGEPLWVRASSHAVFEEGQFKGLRGTLTDISERKQAEQAQRESENKYRNIIENILDVYYRSDHEGNIIMVSRSGAQLLGYESVQDMLGLNIADHFYSDPGDRYMILSEIQKKGYVQDFEVTLKHRDGTPIPVLTSSRYYHDAQGNILGVEGFFRDIRERKRAEKALRDSEVYYRTIFQTSSSAMLIVEKDQSISLVNDAFTRISGYGKEEIVGEKWTELIAQDDKERLLKISRCRLNDPASAPSSYEFRFIHKNGTNRYAIASASLIPGTMRTVASFLDITEMRQAEEEIRRQADELSFLTRLAILGELSASFAHEFNQPLSAILSNTRAAQRLLASGRQNLDEVHCILEDIIRDNERASRIIRRFRSFITKKERDLTCIDINTVIDDSLAFLRKEMTSRAVSVTCELSPAIPPLIGDRIELQQVIINLILNGCDAMMSARPQRRRLHIRTYTDEENILVSIQDAGPGIDPRDMDHIFEPFFTTKSGGLGLGLSISSSIIEAHGGRIWAENNIKQGASFFLQLPIYKGNS